MMEHVMKKLLVLIPSLILSNVAHAEWTGMYAGANIGYDWNSSSMKTYVATPAKYFTGADVAAIDAVGVDTPTSGNVMGGGQVGYHWQQNNLILGFDLDINSFETNTSYTVTSAYPGSASSYTIKQTMSTSFLGTLRPHVGYAHGSFLGYVTGGLAVADMHSDSKFSDDTGSNAYEDLSQPSLKAGWTIGAGVEYSLTTAWSIGAQYLYTSFGNISSTGQLLEGEKSVAELKHDADLTSNIVRLVVNCHFG
jgi:outer membrane immunogenic protein